MDIAFSSIQAAKTATSPWSVAYDPAYIGASLQQAIDQATENNHAMLICITLPAPSCDPLQVYHAFQKIGGGKSFFWSRQSEQHALCGAGEAYTIETRGTERITEAASAWRKLQQHMLVTSASTKIPAFTRGPLLFGGFSFDSLHPRTDLWKNFPEGLLILPMLLFHRDETSAALTINKLVTATTDKTQLASEIEQSIRQLNTLLQSSGSMTDKTALPHEKLHSKDILGADTWKSEVGNAVDSIRQGNLEKVVLARAVQLTSQEATFNSIATLARLSENYPEAYVFALQRDRQYFIGATPERLVCSADGHIQTMALAGSAPRGTTPEEDQRLEQELLHSAKNQGEHRLVSEMIRGALSSLCSRVWLADTPHLLKLKNIQHLETPVMGDLLPERNILDAISDLHPTPAVGGFPRPPALEMIREREHMDRGWYASPVGWVGTGGNGEFAVALRSGLIDDHQAMLFAGCGIVADSDPEAEYQESCWKLQVMLQSVVFQQSQIIQGDDMTAKNA